MRQTVFTPSFNRADKLPRLYNSLLNQTFKDFIWLIIDDGSTDDTEAIVKGFIAEGKIKIKYYRQTNAGKFKAQWTAYQMAETPYVTEIDSDDELKPDAVETFENAWINIEQTCPDKIAKVSMFAENIEGKIVGVGQFKLSDDLTFWDATWHEIVLKSSCHKEFVSSLARVKFIQCYDANRYVWYIGKFLSEHIIWSALGRNYSTRLLNKVGRVVHTDAQNSILRNDKVFTENYINICANNLYFIDENMDYFMWNPRYFLGHYRRLIRAMKNAGLNFNEVAGQFKNPLARRLFYLSYLPFRLI